MRINFENAERYLTVNVSGPYSLAGMMELVDRIAAESAGRSLQYVLVDVSEMSGDAPMSDRHEYAAYAALTLRSLIKKCAACAGQNQRLEPFTEVVAQNRGFPLRVFREKTEAVTWLNAAF